jgi:hypothetical protein
MSFRVPRCLRRVGGKCRFVSPAVLSVLQVPDCVSTTVSLPPAIVVGAAATIVRFLGRPFITVFERSQLPPNRNKTKQHSDASPRETSPSPSPKLCPSTLKLLGGLPPQTTHTQQPGNPPLPPSPSIYVMGCRAVLGKQRSPGKWILGPWPSWFLIAGRCCLSTTFAAPRAANPRRFCLDLCF